MKLLTVIVLGTSSIALANPEASKSQVLLRRGPFPSYDDTHGNLDSRSSNEIDSTMLWRRASQPPSRASRTLGPPSHGAFSNLNPAIPGPSKQPTAQIRQSRSSTDISFLNNGKVAGSAKSSQARDGPYPSRSKSGKGRGKAQSRSATNNNVDLFGDRDMDPVAEAAQVERLKDRLILQENHAFTMRHAKGSIDEANQNSLLRVMEGKTEPDRPIKTYRALKDAKMEVRRAHRDANQKIKAAGQALRQGPATAPAVQDKFDSAHKAVREADRLSGNFQVGHIEASAAAVNDGRWSDFPDHVKKEVKVATRTNANQAYLEAMKAEQQHKHSIEQLSRINPGDSKREEAVARVAKNNVGSIVAKKMYSFHHGLYQDARQKFPDDSSSEDEMDTFT